MKINVIRLANSLDPKASFRKDGDAFLNEINNELSNDKLHLINKFGILKDRFSAIVTDAIRANILQYFGYKTNVMEFVDFENSPKNLLIRAELKNKAGNEKIKEEIDSLLNELNIKQTLYELVFNEK